jgi:hypothetical protein
MPQAEFDFAWDCPVQEVLDFMSKHHLTLVSYEAHGPAGGNPCLILSGLYDHVRLALHELFTNCGQKLEPTDPWITGQISDR